MFLVYCVSGSVKKRDGEELGLEENPDNADDRRGWNTQRSHDHMAWRRAVRPMYREKMKTGGRGMKNFEKIEIKSGDCHGNNFVSKKPEIKSGK